MIAYHGKPEIKIAILAQLEMHRQADAFVKGYYWESGKGCAVGCTIYSGKHVEYETRFGIPQMLARLEDVIFEGLPNEQAKEWPTRFMSAVVVGSDLSLVGWKFLHFILTDERVNPGISNPLVKDAIMQAANIVCRLSKGEPVDVSAAWSAESAAASAAWSAENAAWSAESAAASAAWSAESAAESAARSAASAAWSAARSAAESAARSAASAAESAAWSAARSAAESAARSAASAAWSAAESAARSAAESAASAAYTLMSNKLIELLEAS